MRSSPTSGDRRLDEPEGQRGLAVATVSCRVIGHPVGQLRTRVDRPPHPPAPMLHRSAA